MRINANAHPAATLPAEAVWQHGNWFNGQIQLVPSSRIMYRHVNIVMCPVKQFTTTPGGQKINQLVNQLLVLDHDRCVLTEIWGLRY